MLDHFYAPGGDYDYERYLQRLAWTHPNPPRDIYLSDSKWTLGHFYLPRVIIPDVKLEDNCIRQVRFSKGEFESSSILKFKRGPKICNSFLLPSDKL